MDLFASSIHHTAVEKLLLDQFHCIPSLRNYKPIHVCDDCFFSLHSAVFKCDELWMPLFAGDFHNCSQLPIDSDTSKSRTVLNLPQGINVT